MVSSLHFSDTTANAHAMELSLTLKPQIDYSIIIPAYNEEQFLPHTLQAMRQAMAGISNWSGEIIVVDNASGDATAAIAAEFECRVVYEPVRQISRARNRGAEVARGAILIFVDADTLVSMDLLAQVKEEYLRGGVCGGGALIGTSDEIPLTVRLAIDFWNTLSRFQRWAAGSFIFCFAEAWRDTGGFSDMLFAAEEVFFSRKLKSWGRKRNLKMEILKLKVDTSMRKIEWYSMRQLLWMTLRIFFCPWLLRSRRSCGLWYERPNRNAADKKN